MNDPSISQNTNFQEIFSEITGNITPNYIQQQSKNSNEYMIKQYEKKLAFFF
jgi:hypothetical protein